MSDVISNPACNAGANAALAGRLAALAHPARIEMLRHLAGVPSCCCADVVQRFDLAQSTVSQHLKVLVDAGLVRFSADRQRSRYAIDPEALSALSADFASLARACCPDRR